MSLTRRELMYAAVAGAALLPSPVLQGSPDEDSEGVTLFLNDDNCLARESAAGYQCALPGLGSARAVIVPAISTLSWDTAYSLRAKAQAGHSVILESAFTFTDTGLSQRQFRIVRNVFGFSIELPQDRSENVTTYLRYRWPVDVLVRSFGPPVYIANRDHQPIAHHAHNRHAGNKIVAARKSMGRGQVTFLGSPLGPLLLAEDREATLLIRRMVAESI